MAGKSKVIAFRYRTPEMNRYVRIEAYNLREARKLANYNYNGESYVDTCGVRLPRGTIVEREPVA